MDAGAPADRGSLVVVILAGGESLRIGGGKPLRTLGGETLLARALAAARSWSGDVAVSVRSEEQLGDLPVPVLVDESDVAGPVAGLSAALRHAQGRSKAFLLTIPCDMPFLPADLVLQLAEAMGDDVAVALASSNGHLHPVCALWRSIALDRLPDYLDSGGRSLRGFAEHVGFTAVAWPSAPIDPFFNINTGDELDRAEAILAGKED
jgi:molybdopterin-guanine dinucleotide biosynthesis protein A